MDCLSNIVDFSDSRVFWVDGRGGEITGQKLKSFMAKYAAFADKSTGKRVALHYTDRAKVAQLLCLLDGACARLFIVPEDLGAAILPQLLAQLEIDLLLTDKYVVNVSPEVSVLDVDVVGEHVVDIDNAIPDQTGGDVEATEWIVATSGTTGSPKLVVHALAELSGSLQRGHSKGGEFTWGLLYDLSKYAGLQVYLQSLLGGSALLIPDAGMQLDQQVSYFADNSCNALSATPTLWRKILMLPASRKLQLKRITLGGEIADQSLLDALSNQFPGAKIVHIYASTEAGVGFSVSDGLAGFPESFLVQAPRGVLIKVVDQRLHVKSPNIAREVLNLAAVKGEDGYVDTGDLVELRDHRYHFLGRASGLINVGGNKVYPEEVEQVLLSHEAIKLAHVFAKESHLMGSLVACDLVVNDISPASVNEFKKQVRAYCLEYLSDWKVPALIRLVDDIENSVSGKKIRK